MYKNILEILAIISSIIAMIGHFMSMLQYFKIKAYKEKREYKNIFYEHTIVGPRSIFDGDFIEYFPMTLINKKLDNSWYDNLNDDVLKKMYDEKFNYERIFFIFFFPPFILIGFATDWKITSAY
jgi:hypothetical protein